MLRDDTHMIYQLLSHWCNQRHMDTLNMHVEGSTRSATLYKNRNAIPILRNQNLFQELYSRRSRGNSKMVYRSELTEQS
jgi:hypothetical protein